MPSKSDADDKPTKTWFRIDGATCEATGAVEPPEGAEVITEQEFNEQEFNEATAKAWGDAGEGETKE